MLVDKNELLANAKQILKNNWKSTHTVPSQYLYPHQWSWDSAFTSIGNSHYNQKHAQKELLSMFEGQWKNGMLPHIIFRSKESYFPGPEYWQIDLSENAPKINTSGITQPPVHAIAALETYKFAEKKEQAEAFLKKLYPKLLEFHRYLFTKRDPEKSGLITIFHPWESGFDNSVRWDEALSRIQVKNLPKYERVDIQKVNPDQRPKNEAYDKYIYLLEIMKKIRYEDDGIYEKIPFKIKDIVFSSIAYVANKSLIEIANILSEDNREIEVWMKRTRQNYTSYFCSKESEKALVYDFDLIAKKRIEKRSAASLISLFTGLLKKKQAKMMTSWMKHSHFCDKRCFHNHQLATSVSFDSKEFNPLNYWRGPVWMNINWMIYKGLKNYNFIVEANLLRNAVYELVTEHGFYEYYNPLTGDGLGADNFSWTASLIIDFIYEEKIGG